MGAILLIAFTTLLGAVLGNAVLGALLGVGFVLGIFTADAYLKQRERERVWRR
jgi:hypothetical protein